MLYFFRVMKMGMTFGEKIKRLREIREINQTQLGVAVRMTQRKISYIEHDQCEPSLADLVAFCRYFGVSADYLLGLAEKPQTEYKK